MRIRSSVLTVSAVLLVAAATLVSGCAKKGDPVAEARKEDAASGIAAPGIAET